MKGKISIGRYNSNTKPDICYIKIEDDMSGIPFLEIEITPENLGLALTGLSLMDCNFELFNTALVGKKREMKHELIWVRYHLKTKDMVAAIREAAKEYEQDGWTALVREDSRIEPKRKSEIQWEVSVAFVRYVDNSETEQS